LAGHSLLDIAIVGAGVAGLAAAISLSRDGHRVAVFERFDTSRPVGSGLMIQPSGLAALDRLGLRDEIERRGHRIDRLHGVTGRGTTIFDVAYADLDPVHYAVGIHRAALHGVLWEAFSACGATLETGARVLATQPVSGGRLDLDMGSGRRAGAFDLVVDASGANSPLRTQVTTRKPRPFAYGAVWTTVEDIGLARACLAQRYVAARIMMGYLPVGTIDGSGPPLAALFWSLKPQAHGVWRDGFAGWRGEAERLWPECAPILARLAGPDDFTLASYSHFLAPVFRSGSLVLIGDSAHATSPQLGQGGNQGLIDAVALGDALRASGGVDRALAAYERGRRSQVRFYQAASALLTAFFQSDSTTLAFLRDLLFHRMRHVPYLRREMVRTLAGLKTGLFTSATPDAIAGRGTGGRS
jgi:2-polyprenyl-6-methoxyphenol hydroxylase-like FAD-dependent oxidoreductase